LRNAAKFTPEEGRVGIRIEETANDVKVYVADSGPGIDAEYLDRLGKPFEQINSPLQNGLKGSGLGLAIARSITELHGGKLHIASAIGVGTTICVSLPARPKGSGKTDPQTESGHKAA